MDAKIETPPQEAKTTQPLLVASIVATAFFMENLDATIIATALPMMAQSFAATPVAMGLGLTSYILALAVTLPAAGWIADRHGARTVFAAAIAGFTLASILCGLAQNLPQFVLARVAQGVAGALMSPVGRLVVLRSTDKKDLVRANNFISVPGLVGPLIGPPLGGFIATFLDWRWIFFVNLPVGVLGFFLVRRFIPDLRGEARRDFDIKGFALNALALLALLPGLDLLAHSGRYLALGLALTGAGVALSIFAVRHYKRAAKPLIDLSSLQIKTFAVATMAGGSLFRMAMAAPIFVLPLFLQVGLGYSAFAAGMMVLAHAGGDLGIKVVTTATLKRFGFRTVLIASAASFGALFLGLVLCDASTPIWIVLAILFLSGIVRSLQMTSISSMQFADVPREKFSGAATFAALNQNVMRAVGIAIAALVLNVSAAMHGAAGAPSVFDFHVALALGGLLSLGAAVRYLSLPLDAGRHVSAGRGG